MIPAEEFLSKNDQFVNKNPAKGSGSMEKMLTIKLRDFQLKPKEYIGKKFQLVGANGKILAKVFPPDYEPNGFDIEDRGNILEIFEVVNWIKNRLKTLN